jgi:hypothetical protein
MKPIHHPHLRHKPKNPSRKMNPSQPMAQYLQLPEVPIPTLTPSDSVGTMQVNPNVKPKNQKLGKMLEEKIEVVKADVQRLLDAGFIREVTYP